MGYRWEQGPPGYNWLLGKQFPPGEDSRHPIPTARLPLSQESERHPYLVWRKGSTGEKGLCLRNWAGNPHFQQGKLLGLK